MPQLSPCSIQATLAMTYVHAIGDTLSKMTQITRDRNNQNILALLHLLGSSRPVGFPQVSMQDFGRINLEMDVGETPTLLFKFPDKMCSLILPE